MAEMPMPKPGELQPQEMVNYRAAEDGMQSCSNCGNFMAPDKCALVLPPISAAAVCDLWTPAQSDTEAMDELMGSMAGNV